MQRYQQQKKYSLIRPVAVIATVEFSRTTQSFWKCELAMLRCTGGALARRDGLSEKPEVEVEQLLSQVVLHGELAMDEQRTQETRDS
jgi:hypothetical protein